MHRVKRGRLAVAAVAPLLLVVLSAPALAAEGAMETPECPASGRVEVPELGLAVAIPEDWTVTVFYGNELFWTPYPTFGAEAGTWVVAIALGGLQRPHQGSCELHHTTVPGLVPDITVEELLGYWYEGLDSGDAVIWLRCWAGSLPVGA